MSFRQGRRRSSSLRMLLVLALVLMVVVVVGAGLLAATWAARAWVTRFTDRADWTLRPSGAPCGTCERLAPIIVHQRRARETCDGCARCQTGAFPSLHATAAAYVATLIILACAVWVPPGWRRYALQLAAVLAAVVVCADRVILRCHTVPQVVAGGVLGGAVGAVLLLFIQSCT